jgi:hypothetical protein
MEPLDLASYVALSLAALFLLVTLLVVIALPKRRHR